MVKFRVIANGSFNNDKNILKLDCHYGCITMCEYTKDIQLSSL